MKKGVNLDKKGFLVQRQNKLFKLSFGMLAVACFIAIPAFNIAQAYQNTLAEILSGTSAGLLFVGGATSAAVADKVGKEIKIEEERGI